MSWSVSIIGTPEKICQQLDACSTKLDGQSKVEFDDAKEHLKALVMQNVSTPNQEYGYLVKLTANGHSTFTDGKKTYGQISVAIDSFYGQLAL